jgi:hypothetical protein
MQRGRRKTFDRQSKSREICGFAAVRNLTLVVSRDHLTMAGKKFLDVEMGLIRLGRRFLCR